VKCIARPLDLTIGLNVSRKDIGIGKVVDGFLQETFEAFFMMGGGGSLANYPAIILN